jgi:hypothetical protein
LPKYKDIIPRGNADGREVQASIPSCRAPLIRQAPTIARRWHRGDNVATLAADRPCSRREIGRSEGLKIQLTFWARRPQHGAASGRLPANQK